MCKSNTDYENVESKRLTVIEEISNLDFSEGALKTAQSLVRKSIFYEVGPSDNLKNLMDDVLAEVSYLFAEFFPGVPRRASKKQEQQSKNSNNEAPSSPKQDDMLTEPQVMNIVGEILNTMMDMQNEIQRLSQELSQLKVSLETSGDAQQSKPSTSHVFEEEDEEEG